MCVARLCFQAKVQLCFPAQAPVLGSGRVRRDIGPGWRLGRVSRTPGSTEACYSWSRGIPARPAAQRRQGLCSVAAVAVAGLAVGVSVAVASLVDRGVPEALNGAVVGVAIRVPAVGVGRVANALRVLVPTITVGITTIGIGRVTDALRTLAPAVAGLRVPPIHVGRVADLLHRVRVAGTAVVATLVRIAANAVGRCRGGCKEQGTGEQGGGEQFHGVTWN